MMRRQLKCGKAALYLSALLFLSTASVAATKVLTLSVSGSIAAPPDWQDAASVSIANLAFAFTGFAGSVAAVNVDSTASTVKLVNAIAYPATVALVRPTGCSIGATAVLAANVHFLNNGTAVTTNANINVASAALQSYGMRFAAAGNHGTNSGVVTCTGPGALTYTY